MIDLPIIDSIKTVNGKNANIKLISEDIGKVEKYERVKDGFDYPTDPTSISTSKYSISCGYKRY